MYLCLYFLQSTQTPKSNHRTQPFELIYTLYGSYLYFLYIFSSKEVIASKTKGPRNYERWRVKINGVTLNLTGLNVAWQLPNNTVSQWATFIHMHARAHICFLLPLPLPLDLFSHTPLPPFHRAPPPAVSMWLSTVQLQYILIPSYDYMHNQVYLRLDCCCFYIYLSSAIIHLKVALHYH